MQERATFSAVPFRGTAGGIWMIPAFSGVYVGMIFYRQRCGSRLGVEDSLLFFSSLVTLL
jgi:hypothetical protein